MDKEKCPECANLMTFDDAPEPCDESGVPYVETIKLLKKQLKDMKDAS